MSCTNSSALAHSKIVSMNVCNPEKSHFSNKRVLGCVLVQCLALNILQFDMAMENQAHRGSCPILCEIFPDGPQVKGGKDSNEKWKSMLCNSSWRASCVILGQDDCDEDDDDDSTDGMELDESSPKLEQREDLGESCQDIQEAAAFASVWISFIVHMVKSEVLALMMKRSMLAVADRLLALISHCIK